MMYKVKSAMIVGIALVSILSWPRPTTFTYFSYDAQGTARFDFFKKVVAFHPIGNTLAAKDWDVTNDGGTFALAIFTFLYVDIIYCSDTLYSMTIFSGIVDA